MGVKCPGDNYSGAAVLWLSLLRNFIHQRLNSGSAQVQVLYAACQRFAMVRISGNKAKRLLSVNHTPKTIQGKNSGE